MNRPLPTFPDLSQEKCPTHRLDLSCSPRPMGERREGSVRAESEQHDHNDVEERSAHRDATGGVGDV